MTTPVQPSLYRAVSSELCISAHPRFDRLTPCYQDRDNIRDKSWGQSDGQLRLVGRASLEHSQALADGRPVRPGAAARTKTIEDRNDPSTRPSH